MTESPSTIDALIRHRAALHPDKPMVIDQRQRITFAELHCRLCGALRGDRPPVIAQLIAPDGRQRLVRRQEE